MKQYLHKSLEDHGETVSFSIKKANSYMSLKTQHLQFLDIRSYPAPNYSYDAFIKAYKCKLEKGFSLMISLIHMIKSIILNLDSLGIGQVDQTPQSYS